MQLQEKAKSSTPMLQARPFDALCALKWRKITLANHLLHTIVQSTNYYSAKLHLFENADEIAKDRTGASTRLLRTDAYEDESELQEQTKRHALLRAAAKSIWLHNENTPNSSLTAYVAESESSNVATKFDLPVDLKTIHIRWDNTQETHMLDLDAMRACAQAMSTADENRESEPDDARNARLYTPP